MTAETIKAVRTIVASALDWQEAHATFDAAMAELPTGLRGKRPDGLPHSVWVPHSVWELVEHIRIAQEDLADFMEDANYRAMKWPDDYWPASPAPPSEKAWEQSIAVVRRDRDRIKDIAMRTTIDLTAKIPWGSGQTYLRTILVAVDHTAYHVGQVIAVRRLLGAWPAS